MKRRRLVPAWWLLGPASFFAIAVVACDVIENRKFDPPMGGIGIGTTPTPSRGLGGYGGSSPPFGSGGAGGSSVVYDAGSRTSPCGIPTVGSYCVTTCYTDMPATQSAACEPVSGTWMCAAGWQLASACPPGSCVNTTQGFCCNHATGTLMRPACLASGVLDNCPVGWDPSSTTTCFVTRIPDDAGSSSSTCRDLSNQPCIMQSARCTDSSAVCFCQPVGGSLIWYCAATSPTP